MGNNNIIKSFKIAIIITVLLVGGLIVNINLNDNFSNKNKAYDELKTADLLPDTDLSFADASFIGEEESDYSGASVVIAGDVNGDGYDDILIGAYGNGEGSDDEGQTYLIFGKSSGWSMDASLSNVDASFNGQGSHDYSGCSVAAAGDVNGDDYDDILIGAWGNDEVAIPSGKTYLILGRPSGWFMDASITIAEATFLGENADLSGYSVAGAGDVNGDGYDDILIGAHQNDEGGIEAGQTYLIFGKASGWSKDVSLSNADASFIGEVGGDRSGYSVAGAGDVNGDGYDDILIGAYWNDDGPGTNAGQTYLILGKASGWSRDISLSNADASFIGEASNDYSGYSVAGAGNVNGDDYDDILIGAPENDEGPDTGAGKTYLILGNASGWSMNFNLSDANASFIGEAGGASSGESVAGADDVNGDGCDDILIGAPGAEQTYLILGKASGWSRDFSLMNAEASFIGEVAGDSSGCSVAGGGDVNGDGCDDILIGAKWNDESEFAAGQTYLIFGPNSLPEMNNPSPADGAIGTSINPTLQVNVSDANGQDIMVYFYDNTTGNPVLIGTETVFGGGPGIASLPWIGREYGMEYKWFVKVSDGSLNTTSGMWSFTTENNAPEVNDFFPADDATNTSINPTLRVNVSDANGQDIMVYFYDNTTGNPVLIGTEMVSGGGPGIASLPWIGREYGMEYKWFVKVSDGSVNATSFMWSFTTENNLAPIVNNPSPVNGATSIGLNPTLQVNVFDANGHEITVYFYDNTTGSPVLLGIDIVSGGGPGIASLPWIGREYGMEYKWFVNVSDGLVNSTFSTMSFTTETEAPPPGGIPGYNTLIVLSSVIAITAIVIYLLKKHKVSGSRKSEL